MDSKNFDPCPSTFHILPKDPEDALRIFLNEPKTPIIRENTPITSMGSCFADNIRIYLKSNKFNYLQIEPDCEGFTSNWGRVYNTGSMRQIFDYSHSLKFMPNERWWQDRDGFIVDPYRSVLKYDNKENSENNFQQHMYYSRESILKSEVIILTVGLTETWRSRADGLYYYGRPIQPNPDHHEFHIMMYDEIINDLHAIYTSAKSLNPIIKIILTVSPVPLKATFRSDVCAVSASAFSKAVLLSAVHSFCLSRPDSYYFPSFEIVRDVLNASTDKRGTYSPEILNQVMRVFHSFYIYE